MTGLSETVLPAAQTPALLSLPSRRAAEPPALVGELYKLAGIRTAEIGSVMLGAYNADGSLNPASMELVRLAIPRRVYTRSHIEYDVGTFEEVMKHRKEVRGLRITRDAAFSSALHRALRADCMR